MKDLSIYQFLESTASPDPVPGGGSVSALCGALAAALGEMVARLTIGRKRYAEHEEIMKKLVSELGDTRDTLTDAIAEDADSYRVLMDAFALPKDTDEQKNVRARSIAVATLGAAAVPFKVARVTLELAYSLKTLAEKGNQNCLSDAGVAMMNARTACIGALMNVFINLGSLDMSLLDPVDRKRATDFGIIAAETYKEITDLENKELENVITKLTSNG